MYQIGWVHEQQIRELRRLDWRLCSVVYVVLWQYGSLARASVHERCMKRPGLKAKDRGGVCVGSGCPAASDGAPWHAAPSPHPVPRAQTRPGGKLFNLAFRIRNIQWPTAVNWDTQVLGVGRAGWAASEEPSHALCCGRIVLAAQRKFGGQRSATSNTVS